MTEKGRIEPQGDNTATNQPDPTRRNLLLRLGLLAAAAYAAPSVLQIGDEAHAQPWLWDDRPGRRRRRRGSPSRTDGRRRRRRAWTDDRQRRRRSRRRRGTGS